MATGYKEGSVEDDVKAVIEKTITMSGMKGVEYTIKCPAIPITDALIRFRDSIERDRYIRAQLNGTKIKISFAVDAAERYHQKRQRFVK